MKSQRDNASIGQDVEKSCGNVTRSYQYAGEPRIPVVTLLWPQRCRARTETSSAATQWLQIRNSLRSLLFENHLIIEHSIFVDSRTTGRPKKRELMTIRSFVFRNLDSSSLRQGPRVCFTISRTIKNSPIHLLQLLLRLLQLLLRRQLS